MAEYNLDALGWFQFERLCQSILKTRCGMAVEAWGHAGDLGRDAYAEGSLKFPADQEESGPFVFQAKFVSGANGPGARPGAALLAAVKREVERIRERIEDDVWERPAHYGLMTNAPLTGSLRGSIASELHEVMPDATLTLQGAADLDALLDDSPNVRLAFPQLLGLRDFEALLERVVQADIINRSSLAIEDAKARAQVFVPTTAYSRAITVLTNHGFVVLTGPPEMGKTTIARIAALARLSGGWESYECSGPGDFLRVYRKDQRQVFVADDAFGSTEYSPARADLWAADLDRILRAVDNGHWLLLTSRPAPLHVALERLHLQGGAENFPQPAEVLVNASELSVQEKAQMLYRHAKAAVSDPNSRRLVRTCARAVVDHEHFTPERIRRFVETQFDEIRAAPEEDQEELLASAVRQNLEEPTRSMRRSFNLLPAECKQLMISMLDAGDGEIDVEELNSILERHFPDEGPRSAEAIAQQIDEHFIQLSS